MKKGVRILVVVLGGFFVYFLLVNMSSYLFSMGLGGYGDNSQSEVTNGDILIGIGDSVSVSVTRHRWYGTILEGSGPDATSMLYLFGFLRFPLRVDGTNLIVVHLIALCLVIFLGYRVLTYFRKHDYERGFY